MLVGLYLHGFSITSIEYGDMNRYWSMARAQLNSTNARHFYMPHGTVSKKLAYLSVKI